MIRKGQKKIIVFISRTDAENDNKYCNDYCIVKAEVKLSKKEIITRKRDRVRETESERGNTIKVTELNFEWKLSIFYFEKIRNKYKYCIIIVTVIPFEVG